MSLTSKHPALLHKTNPPKLSNLAPGTRFPQICCLYHCDLFITKCQTHFSTGAVSDLTVPKQTPYSARESHHHPTPTKGFSLYKSFRLRKYKSEGKKIREDLRSWTGAFSDFKTCRSHLCEERAMPTPSSAHKTSPVHSAAVTHPHFGQ